MTELKELQEGFQNYMLGLVQTKSQDFWVPEGCDLEERLAIYREGYYLRLLGALKSDYEVLFSYWGEEKFNRCMREYLQQNPSSYYSIRSVGKNVAQFIKKHYPEDLPSFELAGFEWALNEALFSPDEEVLSLEALSKIDPEHWPHLKFHLHPSVQCIEFHSNAPESWQLLQENKTLKIVKQAESKSYLIWRKQQQSYFCVLNENEKRMISSIQAQDSFSELCEKMSAFFSEEEVVGWVSQSLRRWIEEGVLGSRN